MSTLQVVLLVVQLVILGGQVWVLRLTRRYALQAREAASRARVAELQASLYAAMAVGARRGRW